MDASPTGIPFPYIDPVALQIGPLAIRWYALAYIAGIVIAWRVLVRLAKQPGSRVTPEQVDDFLIWGTIGVVLGGRLGYVLFYQPGYYLSHPLDALALWHGGMSFHGGLLGVVAAILLFCRFRKVPLFCFTDMIALVAPIGLFFGRIANFINGELYGRVTDSGLGMVFPGGGPQPRHPSQLYEAALEGVALFLLLLLARLTIARRHGDGLLTGLFLIGYALARIVAELFREPDAFLGFFVGGITMGQILSLPMLLIGLGLVVHGLRARPAAQGGAATR
ncbi:MAG: prolipoprotein diacylglyceryl transferase [Sneathiellaceae bacterium]